MSRAAACDVLVVGLGPAGSRAAWSAARAGRSVIALDRRRQAGVPVQCAEFVPAMLDGELDGLDAVTRQRIEAMITEVGGGPPHRTENFRGRMLDRAAFDRQLVEAARAAGADCRFASHVREVRGDGTVVLADGSKFRGRVLIGADGPRSFVGRALGRVNRRIVETRQITVRLLRPHDATDIFLSAEVVGGYAWLFPRGDVANVGLGVVPSRKSLLKPLLEDLHRRLVDEGRVGPEVLAHTGGAIPVGGMLDPVGRLGATGVLLAGDAAGLTNPVTGAGINAAVLSGTLAGEAAAARLGGDDDALADYAEELDGLFGASIRRALARRQAVLDSYADGGTPAAAVLRSGWIAWPEYWSNDIAAPAAAREQELEGVR